MRTPTRRHGFRLGALCAALATVSLTVAAAGPEGGDVTALYTKPDLLLAGTGATAVVSSSGRLFRSTDDGLSWEPTGDEQLGGWPVRRIASIGDSLWLVAGLLYRSDDGGLSWTEVEVLAPDQSSALPFEIVGNDEGHLYVGTANAGLLRSEDGGASWSQVGDQPISPIYSVLVQGDDVLIGVEQNPSPLYRLEDGAWTASDQGLEGNFTRRLTASESRIYAGQHQRGVYASDDGGLSWTPASDPSFQNQTIYDLVSKGGTLFALTGAMLYESEDEAKTWRALPDEGPTSAQRSAVTSAGNLRWIGGTFGIQRSDDAGVNWDAGLHREAPSNRTGRSRR